jgi:hypothetical protein
VEFAGIMHPGLIGCLPSAKLLDTGTNARSKLFATDPERVPPLAALPYAPTAHLGRMKGELRRRPRWKPPAPFRRANTAATATSRISARLEASSSRSI